MTTRHYTYEDLEKESKKLDCLFAVCFGIVTAITCGIAFYMVIDGILHTF